MDCFCRGVCWQGDPAAHYAFFPKIPDDGQGGDGSGKGIQSRRDCEKIFKVCVCGKLLKPIINGIGNYYIEAQTRDGRRTDIIVDYLGKVAAQEYAKPCNPDFYPSRFSLQMNSFSKSML